MADILKRLLKDGEITGTKKTKLIFIVFVLLLHPIQNTDNARVIIRLTNCRQKRVSGQVFSGPEKIFWHPLYPLYLSLIY